MKRKSSGASGGASKYRKSTPYTSPLAYGALQALKRGNVPRSMKRFNVRLGGYNRLEKKFLDTTLSTTAITSTGIILNSGTLNVIPQGDTQSERNGRKCTVTNIVAHFNIKLPFDAAGTDLDDMHNKVRIILYQDMQCNKATATVAQILQATNVNSFRNLEYIDRFKLLHDKMYVSNPKAISLDVAGTGFAHPSQIVSVKINKKVRIPLTFDSTATTGAIGTITSNNIGMLAIATNSDPLSFLDGIVRIRFVDN